MVTSRTKVLSEGTAEAPKLGPERKPSPLGVERVLDTAFITAPEKRDPKMIAKLDAVAGRVLKG